MKILMLNHNIRGEGTFFRAYNFAANLGANNDITIMTVSESSFFFPKFVIEGNIKIVECPRFLDIGRGGWAPLDIVFRMFYVLFNKFDIIHAFDHKPNVYYPAVLAKKLHKKSLLVSDWADWWGKGGINGPKRNLKIMLEEILEEKIRKVSDIVTVLSLTLRERTIGIGIKPEKIFYIPQGCNINKIKPVSPSKKTALKKKYKIEPNAKIMEFIGFGQGDLGYIFDAFIEIKKRENNAIFLIVGPLEDRYKNMLHSHPCKESIIVTGKVDIDTVAQYAAIADLFLMPLADNVMNAGRGPTKIGDYMAAGKPIIANPVGDISIWIKKYDIGLTSKYESKDIAKKVLKLFKDNKLALKLGKNARQAAEKVFSWKIEGREMEKIYFENLIR